MTDVTHDPKTDWCACEPEGYWRCGYRLLADALIAKLNPRDSDDAEVSLCIDAVSRTAAYVQSLPCTCKPGPYDEPCGRCAALGLWNGEPVGR